MKTINKSVFLTLLTLLFLTGCSTYTPNAEAGIYTRIQEGKNIYMTDASAQELTNKLLYSMSVERGYISLDNGDVAYLTAAMDFYANKISKLYASNVPVSDELNTKYVLLKEFSYNSGTWAITQFSTTGHFEVLKEYLNAANTGSKGIVFEVAEKEGKSLLKITDYTGSDLNVVIPDTINGVPITSIEESAFADKNLTGIVVGKNVTEIKTKAFIGNKFTSIDLPDNTTVEPDSFDVGVNIK